MLISSRFLSNVRLGIGPVLAASLMAGVGAFAAAPDPLVEAAKEWMDTNAERAREAAAWGRERAHMEEMISLLEAERAVLRERLEQNKTVVDQGALERLMWERTRTQQEESLAGLAGGVETLERALLQSVAALPDAKQKELRGKYTIGVGERSLSERMRGALGLAVELNTLNHSIFRGQMTMKDSSGDERRLDTLFVGVSQAFAVTPQADMAAHGVWNGTEWVWRWEGAMAPAIRQAMLMQNGERAPEWLRLPVAIISEKAAP